jgi:hypothetical protein
MSWPDQDRNLRDAPAARKTPITEEPDVVAG